MNIRKSAEDYLEQILMIREQRGAVRSIDIAAGLGVTKPSVSVAMKRLRENGYILMDESNLITLTPAGEKIAANIYDRHKTLARCLQLIGVPDELAHEDACKLEHDISQETFEALVKYLEKHETQA